MTTYYCLAGGAVAYLFIYGFGLNLGTIMLAALIAALGFIAAKLWKKDASAKVGAGV